MRSKRRVVNDFQKKKTENHGYGVTQKASFILAISSRRSVRGEFYSNGPKRHINTTF